jgi:ubiquinone/menaquinone biosynthesis C-methylase UbiE
MAGQSAAHALYYTDNLIENLQLRWGDGFMSPGGADELRRMFEGIDLTGATVLDLGCGIGGYDRLLVEEHRAGHVTGIDIDGASVAAARAMAAAGGLQARLEFRTVEPGPLPFDDGTFDIGFSKDSIVDVTDKRAVLAELYRVVDAGGHVVVSDWFRSAEPYTEEMWAWATAGDETYEMDTIESAASHLDEAGFIDIVTDDRNDWFQELARDEHQRLKGPLYSTYVEKFGEEQARSSVENARIRLVLAEQGQLRPGHVRARKP